jgi:hypothetical protein
VSSEEHYSLSCSFALTPKAGNLYHSEYPDYIITRLM